MLPTGLLTILPGQMTGECPNSYTAEPIPAVLSRADGRGRALAVRRQAGIRVNYSDCSLIPVEVYKNYPDEAIYFTGDRVLAPSSRARSDASGRVGRRRHRVRYES